MLKELKTQHRTIIQMVFSGFSNNEIAERLEMSPASVSTIIRSPLGQAYLGGLNDKAQEATLDVRKKLTSLNKSALATFERVLKSNSKAPHAVQVTVAKDVLDRNGYKPPDKHVIDMTLSTKTDQEIDAEIAAMQESILKTQTQDPIKQIADDEPEPEQISDPEQETLEIIEPLDLGIAKITESVAVTVTKIPEPEPEIPSSILNKIPTDLFDSQAKDS